MEVTEGKSLPWREIERMVRSWMRRPRATPIPENNPKYPASKFSSSYLVPHLHPVFHFHTTESHFIQLGRWERPLIPGKAETNWEIRRSPSFRWGSHQNPTTNNKTTKTNKMRTHQHNKRTKHTKHTNWLKHTKTNKMKSLLRPFLIALCHV